MSVICFNFRTKESMSYYRIFIGFPGVGKSTLINCLERRVLFESGGNDEKVMKDPLQKKQGRGITYLEIPIQNDIEWIRKAAKTIKDVVQTNVKYQIFFVVKTKSKKIPEQELKVIQLVLETTGNITSYHLIINKLSNIVYTMFSENENLRLVFPDQHATSLMPSATLNNMEPASSLLLRKETALHDGENVFVKLKKLDEFVEKAPYANEISGRDKDYSGNDT